MREISTWRQVIAARSTGSTMAKNMIVATPAAKNEGQTTAPMRDAMFDFDQLNALIGTPELLALGRRYE